MQCINMFPAGPIGRLRSTFVASFGLFLAVAPGAVAGDGLERATGAIGRLEKPIEMTGHGRFLGADAEFRTILHPDGRYIRQIVGPVGMTQGFDGETCWQVDWTGTPHELLLGQRSSNLALTWIGNSMWSEPELGFEIRELEESPEEGSRALELSLDEGRFEGTLLLDSETGRPRMLKYSDEGSEKQMALDDLREVHGALIPFDVTYSQEGGFRQQMIIDHVAEWTGDTDALFAPQLGRPDDVFFDPDVPARLVTKRAVTGHLLVQASLEGDEERWFILDSGAGAMCISRSIADGVDMEAFGEVPAVGVGGTIASRFRQGAALTVGPVTMEKPIFVELDLSFLEPAFGVPIAGICGFGLFTRSIVSIETATAVVELYDPAEFDLQGADWEELVLYTRHPCVRGTFEGDRDGLFRLDTGATGTVTFHKAAVEEHGLLEDRAVQSSSSGGVGGNVPTKIGQIDWFELGGHRFEKPTVEFATHAKGAFSDESTTGNLGKAFLDPFRIVFDYVGERISFIERQP